MKMITALVSPLLVLSLALVASVPATASDIQKCLDWEGTIVYQDTPCEKGTEIGKIPRDTSRANPDAIRRAEEDRRLLANILLAKASRSPAVQVTVHGQGGVSDGAVAVATDSGYASDGYVGPLYGASSGEFRRHRGFGRQAGEAQANVLRPSPILDSPAPCNTLQCRQAARRAPTPAMRPRH